MALSIDPAVYERLRDLREEHERMARRVDELHRAVREGSAVEDELREAERREREAYSAWRLARKPMERDPAHRPRESPPDDAEIPRDR